MEQPPDTLIPYPSQPKHPKETPFATRAKLGRISENRTFSMTTIIPSIDILGGTTVQLVGGDEAKKKVGKQIGQVTDFRLMEVLQSQ